MVLPDFLKRFRNRLLTDPKFIAFAQRFLLTRPVARRKSLELFNLLAGFSYSQVLYTCVDLGVFNHLNTTVVELSPKIGLSEAKTETLIKAAVAIRLLDWDANKIILGPQGATLVAQPWIMRFVEHHKYFYRDLENPVAMLKGTAAKDGLRSYWNYEDPTHNRNSYSALMAASQAAVSEQILRAYDMSRFRSILDIGGGTGAFLEAVGKRYPHMERHVFDLPGVTSSSEGITRHSGDFRSDPLPQGMDLITLVRVVHDHNDDAVLTLLRNIKCVCSPTTALLIAEPFAGKTHIAPVTDAYFNMYFAAMGQGKTRTPREIANLAKQAGLGGLKLWPTNMPLITGVLSFSPDSSNV